MDNTTVTLNIIGVLVLFFALVLLVVALVLFFKKKIVFQGEVISKQKTNPAGLLIPPSQIPSHKADNLEYRVTIEYSYLSGKKVESGRTGEIREVEITKTKKQSFFLCDNEVEFANYKIGETYWFVGEDENDSYMVV